MGESHKIDFQMQNYSENFEVGKKVSVIFKDSLLQNSSNKDVENRNSFNEETAKEHESENSEVNEGKFTLEDDGKGRNICEKGEFEEDIKFCKEKNVEEYDKDTAKKSESECDKNHAEENEENSYKGFNNEDDAQVSKGSFSKVEVEENRKHGDKKTAGEQEGNCDEENAKVSEDQCGKESAIESDKCSDEVNHKESEDIDNDEETGVNEGSCEKGEGVCETMDFEEHGKHCGKKDGAESENNCDKKTDKEREGENYKTNTGLRDENSKEIEGSCGEANFEEKEKVSVVDAEKSKVIGCYRQNTNKSEVKSQNEYSEERKDNVYKKDCIENGSDCNKMNLDNFEGHFDKGSTDQKEEDLNSEENICCINKNAEEYQNNSEIVINTTHNGFSFSSVHQNILQDSKHCSSNGIKLSLFDSGIQSQRETKQKAADLVVKSVTAIESNIEQLNNNKSECTSVMNKTEHLSNVRDANILEEKLPDQMVVDKTLNNSLNEVYEESSLTNLRGNSDDESLVNEKETNPLEGSESCLNRKRSYKEYDDAEQMIPKKMCYEKETTISYSVNSNSPVNIQKASTDSSCFYNTNTSRKGALSTTNDSDNCNAVHHHVDSNCRILLNALLMNQKVEDHKNEECENKQCDSTGTLHSEEKNVTKMASENIESANGDCLDSVNTNSRLSYEFEETDAAHIVSNSEISHEISDSVKMLDSESTKAEEDKSARVLVEEAPDKTECENLIETVDVNFSCKLMILSDTDKEEQNAKEADDNGDSVLNIQICDIRSIKSLKSETMEKDNIEPVESPETQAASEKKEKNCRFSLDKELEELQSSNRKSTNKLQCKKKRGQRKRKRSHKSAGVRTLTPRQSYINLPDYLLKISHHNPSLVVYKQRTNEDGQSVKVQCLLFDGKILSWAFHETLLSSKENSRRVRIATANGYVFPPSNLSKDSYFPVDLGHCFPFSISSTSASPKEELIGLSYPLERLSSLCPQASGCRTVGMSKGKTFMTVKLAEEPLEWCFKETMLSSFADSPILSDLLGLSTSSKQWPESTLDILRNNPIDYTFSFTCPRGNNVHECLLFSQLIPNIPSELMEDTLCLPSVPPELEKRMDDERDILVRLLAVATVYSYLLKAPIVQENPSLNIVYTALVASFRPLIISQANRYALCIKEAREILLHGICCSDETVVPLLIHGSVHSVKKNLFPSLGIVNLTKSVEIDPENLLRRDDN